MEIAGLIALYSILVLTFLTILGGSLVLAARWLINVTHDPDGH